VNHQDKIRKIFIAAGGTGGHVFPALRTAAEFRKQGHRVFFIGVFKGSRETIRQEGYPVIDLFARGFVSGGVWILGAAFVSLIKSFVKAWSALKQENPDVILGFGAYAAFPSVMAAVLQGYPTVIHEQNVRPGLANWLLAFFVSRIAMSFEASRPFFPRRKAVVTGYPCRSLDVSERAESFFHQFGLTPGIFTILVLGGSQGSHCINSVFLECLRQQDVPTPMQFIHASGPNDFSDLQQKYQAISHRCYLVPFLTKMDKAYAVADLVICRAGAGTITELAGTGRPAIIIPYRFAGGHQSENARLLIGTGTAVIIHEAELTPERLAREIRTFYGQTRGFRQPPGAYPDGIFKPDAAQRLARETLAVIKK